ncbi:MAG: phosphomethylpyrimidine synthase ThiC, partial [Desulfobacteraceae bacterium]|nr:phosphomethylpyrimidine synthase ThiC [Desulfobacteraceae bacterium]
MTQLESAKSGHITDGMRQVAEAEGISAGYLCEEIARGRAVIPKNTGRDFYARGIGKGLKTKVNANIGTSPSRHDPEEELAKLDASVAAGADAVMDLSTGGDLDAVLKAILKKSPVMT